MASFFVSSLLPGLLLLLAAPVAAIEAAAPAEPLTGRVLPAAAAAVARVEVWPQCPPADETARPLATVRPGADGRFQVAPPDEPFRLRVEAPGFLPAEPTLSLGASSLPPLRMQRAEALELTLAGPDGAPLAGIPLVLSAKAPATSGAEGWGPAGRTAVTGPDGRASVPRRPGEILTLLPRTPRFLGFYSLTAASPQRLVLTPGRPLSLTAVDPGGRPVAGARVRLWEWTIGRTDSQGRLELNRGTDLAGTTLTVEDETGRQGEVAVGDSATLTAVLRPGREVAGRVLDAATRQPIAGARLDIGCRVAARTAADGGFRLAARSSEKGALASASGYLPGFLGLDDPTVPDPFTVTLQRAAVLAVRVVDEQGAAVAGAQINAFPAAGGDAGPLQGTSSPAGAARLGPAAIGWRYEVTAERDGFSSGRVVVQAVRAPATAVEIVLTRGATVVGRLAGDGGEPVAGGEVSLQREPDSTAGFAHTTEPPLRAATDAEGRFELRRLAAGLYRLTARAPGRAPAASLPVEIPAGVAQVDLGTLSLAAGETLEGRVVDDRDRPVAGAVIVVSTEQGGLPPVESGVDGSFRVADLEPGKAALWVRKDGFVSTTLSGLAIPSPEPVVVRLRTGRALTGRVVGPRGEAVAGAAIVRLSGDAHGSAQLSSAGSIAYSNTAGRFRAEGLEIGLLNLQVEAAGYRTRRLQTEIPADRDAGPLEVVLEAGAVVEGRVTTDGKPLIGGTVSGAPLDSGGPVAGVVVLTDADGRYRLEGLATGRHAIEVADNEGRHAHEELEVQPGRQELDIHLTAGEVTGRAVDASGAPAAGTEIQILGPQRRIVRSGRDGSFAFRSLLAGTYRLTARHPVAGEAVVPAVEVAGQPVALPDLVLDAGDGVTVSGRLLGLALHDLARAWVRATPVALEAGSSAVPIESRVDSDGSYRLIRLVPGTWRIEAGAGERRPVSRQLQLAAGEQAELDLELADGATLSGRVTVNDEPAAGLRVLLTPDGGEARTGDDGTFTLRDVRAGDYTLQVLLDGGLSWTQPVAVDGDQTVEVEIATGAIAGRVSSSQGPAAGVQVTAQGQAGTSTTGVATDDDGAFRFPRLLPGRYRLSTHTGGPTDATAEVTVTAGNESSVELQLP